MRASLASLTGTTVSFDRSGRRLVVIEPDAVAVVELAAGKTLRLPYPDVRATAAFDDQLWLDEHRVPLGRAAAGER